MSSLEGQDDSDDSDDDSAGILPVPSHSLIKSYAKTPGTVLTNGDLTGGADGAYSGSSNTRFQKRSSDPSQLQAQLAECSFLSDGGGGAAIDHVRKEFEKELTAVLLIIYVCVFEISTVN